MCASASAGTAISTPSAAAIASSGRLPVDLLDPPLGFIRRPISLPKASLPRNA